MLVNVISEIYLDAFGEYSLVSFRKGTGAISESSLRSFRSNHGTWRISFSVFPDQSFHSV